MGFEPADGGVGEFGGVGEAEFFADPDVIGLHGFHADVEIVGDAARGVTGTDPAEDIALAVTERFGRGGGGAGRTREGAFGESGEDEWVRVEFAGVDLADGRDDLAGGLALHHVAEGAGAKGAFDIADFLVHRKHQHTRGGEVDAEVFDEFEAGAVFEAEVDDGDIGRVGDHRGEGGGGGVGLSADIEIGFEEEEIAEPVPDEGVVVDEEDADAGAFVHGAGRKGTWQ